MRSVSNEGEKRRKGRPEGEETVTVRVPNLDMVRRMNEAARLLRSLALSPEGVETEVDGGSDYGRVSFATDYLCFSGRDLETFQRAVYLAAELVVCALEDETFVVELSFPGIFSRYEVRGGRQG